MSGFPLTQAASVEVVVASQSGQKAIPSVAATPGWHVIDEFPLTRSVNAGIDVVGLVSDSGLTLKLRLVDATDGSEVGSVVTITELVATRKKGGRVDLTGGKIYQLQAECTGSADEGKFGAVQNAGLAN